MSEQAELKRLKRRAGQLKKKRDLHVAKWRDIDRSVMGGEGIFDNDTSNDGDKRATDIVNKRPMRSAEIATAGMTAGLATESRDWFALGVPSGVQETAQAKRWLYDVKEAAKAVLSKSNFYSALPQVLSTELGFGTGVLFVDSDEDDLVRFVHVPIGTFCIDTDSKNRVNTIYREFKLTTDQMVEQFGIDQVSDQVRAEKDSGKCIEHVVCHLVEPNPEAAKRGETPFIKRYKSSYWEDGRGCNNTLRESGYRQFPALCPRWRVVGQGSYGKGLGELAAGKARELQLLEADKMRIVQQIARPAMTMPISMKGQGSSFQAGRTIWLPDNLVGVKAEPVYRPDHQAVQQLATQIEACEKAIAEIFYEDLFLLISQSDGTMTAYEVGQRKEEKMQMLGPVADRNNDELFDPLMDILFMYLYEQSEPAWLGYSSAAPLIPQPPEELHGVEIKVEYLSILSQAQKAASVGSIERALQFTGLMVQAGFQDAIDNIDPEAAIAAYNEAIGTPPPMLRSAEQVAAIRQQRAQAQAVEQEMAQAQALLQGVKTMAETPTTGDSLLNGLMGG